MRDESRFDESNPVDLLDRVKTDLETFSWPLGPSSLPGESAAAIRRACDLIEATKFRQLGVPTLYEGDVSSDWCGRILVGPGRKEGLGNYNPEKSLGRFVRHGMEMDIRDLRRKNIRHRSVEILPEWEPADPRQNLIDGYEYRELVLVALSRVQGRTEPGSLMFRILEAMGDYRSEFPDWPSYQWIADRLGIQGNRNHICEMRNKALKAIDDEVRKMMEGF